VVKLYRLVVKNFHFRSSTRLAQSFELVISVALSQKQDARIAKILHCIKIYGPVIPLRIIMPKRVGFIMVQYHHHPHGRCRFKAVSPVLCNSFAFR
jgi:hypothetical protein